LPLPFTRIGNRTFSWSRAAFSGTTAPTSKVAPKNVSHEIGVLFDNVKRAAFDPIAERDHSAN
jgi:hypothetical protein